MNPDFTIKIDGSPLGDDIKHLVKRITTTDDIGVFSDTCEIAFNDHGNLRLPRLGVWLSIALGFKETEVVEIGDYIIDEIDLVEGTLTVKGKGFNTNVDLKSKRSVSHKSLNLSDIIKEIAERNGLNPLISPSYQGVGLARALIQQNESDLHLMTRLAKIFNAAFKIRKNDLLFAEKKRGKSVSEQKMPTINVDKKIDCINWNALISGRNSYDHVECSVIDPDTGTYQKFIFPEHEKKKKATKHKKGLLDELGENAEKNGKNILDVFSDKPAAQTHVAPDPKLLARRKKILKLAMPFASKEEAKKQALAILKDRKFESRELHMTVNGKPRVIAESFINAVNFRDGIDGKWYVKKVVQTLDGSYRTEIECRTSSDEETEFEESADNPGIDNKTTSNDDDDETTNGDED